MKKYQLTSETITVNGRTLHRIQALRDFADVEKGELGGFVENESNLSQEGNCWVYDDAKVYDNATVEGDAKVRDNAIIADEASVYGNAHVYGNAKLVDCSSACDYTAVRDNAIIADNAYVCDEGVVCDNALVCEYAKVYGNGYVKDDATIFGDEKVGYCAVANICDDVTEEDFFDDWDCGNADAETREHFGITEPIFLDDVYSIGDADEDELQKQADAYYNRENSNIDELFDEMYNYFENVKIRVRDEKLDNYVAELRKKANCK